MPKSTTSYLNDINVWVALVYDGHVHHSPVLDWFDGLDNDQARFCRFTQLGLLRMLTNQRVMGPEVMGQRAAWAAYDKLRQDPRVAFQEEGPQVESVLRVLTQGSRAETNVWADAYLAAIATSSGLTIATLDRGFRGFRGIDVQILG
jgi:toxin-antitoxin system PIN domain toxin